MAKPREQTEIHSMERIQIHSTAQTQIPSQETPPKPVVLRRNMKLLSAGFSFFVAGTNDGSIGALLPYIIQYYNVNTSLIAVL